MNLAYLKSDPAEGAIAVSGAFPAPVDRVWRAWTVPEQFIRWFGREGGAKEFEADVRVGGRWRLEFDMGDAPNALEGEYLVVEENARLVFTWTHVRETPEGETVSSPQSTVSVIFRQIEGGTELSLTHTGVQTLDARQGISHGWDACFVRLLAILES